MVLKNIIFDWSGTLVNDLPPVMGATNYILRKLGKEEMTLDEFRAEFCLPFTRFYERVAPGVDPRQLETWFHEAYIPLQDKVEALEHAEVFLQFVKSSGSGVSFQLDASQHYESCRGVSPSIILDHPYVGSGIKGESGADQ